MNVGQISRICQRRRGRRPPLRELRLSPESISSHPSLILPFDTSHRVSSDPSSQIAVIATRFRFLASLKIVGSFVCARLRRRARGTKCKGGSRRGRGGKRGEGVDDRRVASIHHHNRLGTRPPPTRPPFSSSSSSSSSSVRLQQNRIGNCNSSFSPSPSRRSYDSEPVMDSFENA